MDSILKMVKYLIEHGADVNSLKIEKISNERGHNQNDKFNLLLGLRSFLYKLWESVRNDFFSSGYEWYIILFIDNLWHKWLYWCK